jgi:hypothetical protein
MSVLTHFPKNRLTEMVARFGGLSRDDAVAAASKELETMRGEADQVIDVSVAQLEKTVAGCVRDRKCGPDTIKELLPLCDQIVTLSGTYEYRPLNKATRSLCDLLDGLLRSGKTDIASILVHVQTIRMMAPRAAPMPVEQVDMMMMELAKLLAHHHIAGLEASTSQDSEDAAIGATG